MMRVLITGACGFIGSNVLNTFLNRFPECTFVNVDKLDYCANEANVRPAENYAFVYGDICHASLLKFILETYAIDTILHFAAQTHVDNSFGNSLQFTRDNVVGTHTLLECCREYGKVQRFVHMSTDEVYGEVDLHHEGCHEEKSLLNPTNPYAATKAAAEFLCKAYHASFGLPIIIVRCNNVYGPNQYPEKLIPKFIHLLSNNQKCPIHGKGETRRNFIHASDVASAFLHIVEKGEVNEVYNIGTCNEYSVLEVFRKLCAILKPGENAADWMELVEDRAFNDFRYAVNSDKLRALGWSETADFDKELYSLATANGSDTK